MDQIRGGRILDLGMGAGRTVPELMAISPHYTGIDYAPEMVTYCQARFPGLSFQHADARSLPFENGQFDLVMFSCNGISMVDHAGRLAILREIRRVLAPDGVFIFSTCNRNSPECRSGFRFPKFEGSWNPLKVAVRSLRFGRDTGLRLRNRKRLKPQEVATDDYAIINDIYHHYGVMLYFISPVAQRRQLREQGFASVVDAFDLSGQRATDDSHDVTLTFVVRS